MSYEKQRYSLKKIQKHCTEDNDAPVLFKVGTLGPHMVLPIAINNSPVVFSWILSTVWNLFPSKGDFSFWESKKSQASKSGPWPGGSGVGGLSHLGDLTFCQKTLSEMWCMRRRVVIKLPITLAVVSWITRIGSEEECSNLMQNWMQIHCSTHSVILNVMATQYTCSLNSIYHPHWLVQWSHHCSHMRIPVHSPWLSGYIDVAQTVLIILTVAGLFRDRPGIYVVEKNTHGKVLKKMPLAFK